MTKVTSNSRLMYDQSHQLFNGYGELGIGHWALKRGRGAGCRGRRGKSFSLAPCAPLLPAPLPLCSPAPHSSHPFPQDWQDFATANSADRLS